MPRRARLLVWVAALGGFFWLRVAKADEPSTPPNAAPPASSAPATDSPANNQDPAAKGKDQDAEYYELFKVFADTMDQVERNYVKDVSRRELMEAAIRGVLDKLDPYSNYISPGEMDRFKTSIESQFGGIGIQVDMRQGRLMIVSPLVNSPAYRAGLQAGDTIVEIEGKSLDGISLDEAIRRMKGEAGTSVTLTVQPRGAERRTLTLTREMIRMETVRGERRDNEDHWDFMLDHDRKIGYIRVDSFSRETYRDLQRAMHDLEKQHLRGLVIDLRFNPGGLLTSAVEVADLFLPDGEIVSTAGRNSPKRSWTARKPGTYEGFPMAILVNRASASASEVVSAALQDHKRAVVIGERTWGKASVQNVIELEGGKSMLKLTTAGYQRPNGHNIHRAPDAKESDEWGVMPDPGYEIKLDDKELAALFEYRRKKDILLINHALKPKEDASPPPAVPPDAVPAATDANEPKSDFVDRQLQKALEYLSGELAKAP
ncbi:MAG TPA: S41 family peptidase [Pirellulales bacterium]|nr:S41 family peptidase [Pirellulales bacterium]